MDDRQFDSMVRSRAAGSSRRQVLKGLLGLGAVAGGVAVMLWSA
jgi:serine-rich repeat adhesion-like glycoprotein